MEEQGVRLLKSEISSRPLEISGQYLLLSYLTAALQSVGGYVTIESLASAGEMDILAFYRNQRFIVETKVWYGQAKFDQGKAQLVDYLQATGLPKGWLVVFDEKLAENPLLSEGKAIFETTAADKVLRVYQVARYREHNNGFGKQPIFEEASQIRCCVTGQTRAGVQSPAPESG